MSAESIALLGLILSTLITLWGWRVTATTQDRILKETTKIQRIDREVAAFRERLSTVRGITGTLLDQECLYAEFAAMVLSGQFNMTEGAEISKQLTAKGIELDKLLYDPGFRAIRALLSAEHSERINEQLRSVIGLSAKFHGSAAALGTAEPSTQAQLKDLAAGALAMSRECARAADLLADQFAVLDRVLASGTEDSPTDGAPNPARPAGY